MVKLEYFPVFQYSPENLGVAKIENEMIQS